MAGRFPGQLRRQIRDASQQLHDRGVEIYVVAIGSDVDRRNYYPDLALRRSYVYNPIDYDRMDNVRTALVRNVRQGTALDSPLLCDFFDDMLYIEL